VDERGGGVSSVMFDVTMKRIRHGGGHMIYPCGEVAVEMLKNPISSK